MCILNRFEQNGESDLRMKKAMKLIGTCGAAALALALPAADAGLPPVRHHVRETFDPPRAIRGFWFRTPTNRVNISVRTATFKVNGRVVKARVPFAPLNSGLVGYTTWEPVVASNAEMSVDQAWDGGGAYYAGFFDTAAPDLPRFLDAPRYETQPPKERGARMADYGFFDVPPDFLPLPNKPHEAYPARMVTNSAARAAALAPFREKFTQFIYVKHLVMGNSIVFTSDDPTDWPFDEYKGIPDHHGGSELCRATILPDGSVTNEVLLASEHGVVRDPALSFDAKTLVFSMRRSFEKDDYHLYKMDLATRRVTQITFDSPPFTCSDIEPAFLPDGSIVFQSTRCSQTVDCWPLAVSNLYRCDADGRHVRRIGYDQVNTLYPQLLDDGRVVYSRWEYNDRNAQNVCPLMVMDPDGRRQKVFFGGNSAFPTSLLHARGVPGSPSVFCVSGGHHQAQKGKLVEIDPNEADDFSNSTYDESTSLYGLVRKSITLANPNTGLRVTMPWAPYAGEISGPAVTNMPGMYYLSGGSLDGRPGRRPALMPRYWSYYVMDGASQFGAQGQYPFPLDRERYLAAYHPHGQRNAHGPFDDRFGIYALSADGATRELLAFDWGNNCGQPVPVMARTTPPRVLKPDVDGTAFGTYYVQDVYAGAAIKGVKRGSLKKLRVIALEYRPAHIGWNWQYGPSGMYGKIGTPIALGNAAYDVKHVLGEVDVEADGSCFFEAPARTPLYFQLIDDRGRCAQTMRSWSTLRPGEFNGCVGCHEHPHESATATAYPAALARAPRRLAPVVPALENPTLKRLYGTKPLDSVETFMAFQGPGADKGGLSFAKTVQPILDRRCVSCHDAAHPKKIDLRGVACPIPKEEDDSHRTYSAAYVNLSRKGACDAKVNFAHGRGDAPFHPPYTFGSAKSAYYAKLEAGHGGLSPEELRTIACWIDCCCPFAGDYREANAWNETHRIRYDYFTAKRVRFAMEELNDIRQALGLPPLAEPDWVSRVKRPAKQRSWAD